MRRRLWLYAAILGGLTATTLAPVSAGDKDKKSDDGWVSLFNGQDLTGWKTHPKNPGQWRVENGVLVSSGKDTSHLFSERDDYKDFHFRIGAKISHTGQSGHYFSTDFGPGYP